MEQNVTKILEAGRRRYAIRTHNGPTINVWADTAEDAIAAVGLYGEESAIAAITVDGVTILGDAPLAELANVGPLAERDAAELDELLYNIHEHVCLVCFPTGGVS